MRITRRPTILLVEDSPDEEMLIMRAIRRSKFPCQLLVAHTTEQALDFLFARGPFVDRASANPDVVITDLKVGALGGAELISKMKENAGTRLIPVVVLTGSSSSEQIEDLYRRGANSFLEKPMDFDVFAETITKMTYYWGLLNASPALLRRAPSYPFSS